MTQTFPEGGSPQVLAGGYCPDLNHYSRFLTREIQIGHLPMGGSNPIRIQSMTTTDTMDTLATVEQTIRMVHSGCDYVRITAPSMREAENLAAIKKELRQRGYAVPLIADIHFTPNAAEMAARLVEKVRVNPGNYADKKRFENLEYTATAYQAELERIYKKFTPLVKICKEYGTAMRIGTNHGSLSDRIMSHYGDTPRGMVESAMEFIRMCEDQQFYNLCISMKASNTQVMVQAYRLLVETMVKEGMNYPLHLGVTEAGDGEDGRIKSAVGIGTLLADGLGDTIRVSLTEDPEFEAPVARALAARYEKGEAAGVGRRAAAANNPAAADGSTPAAVNPSGLAADSPITLKGIPATYSPYTYTRRITQPVQQIGGHQPPVVMLDIQAQNLKDPYFLAAAGYQYHALLDKYTLSDLACDFVYMGEQLPSFALPGGLGQIYRYTTWRGLANKQYCYPVYSAAEYLTERTADENGGGGEHLTPAGGAEQHPAAYAGGAEQHPGEATQYPGTHATPQTGLHFVEIDAADFPQALLQQLHPSAVIILHTAAQFGIQQQRAFMVHLQENKLEVPLILKRNYSESDAALFSLGAAADLGALLTDGFGDGICLDAPHIPLQTINASSFGILQATRTRISKTEYISCPSCGRTLFDLQETTQYIRAKTDHLKGIKIAIMGCIVNGPGEMADADYGYVGTGPGKITLYRGKEVVKKNVDTPSALSELIDIIREDGNWIEK